MKQLHLYLILLFFSLGQQAFSQWYFEAGFNDAAFTKFDEQTPTTINAFKGLRDFSLSAGYLFPLKSLEKRAQADSKPFPIRFGVGVGFDEMNLRNKMVVGNTEFPVTYNLGQLQGRLGLYYVPTLLRKRQVDAAGFRNPIINLMLNAGLSYNIYTSATRTVLSNTSSVSNLKEDKQFVNEYPAFSFGAGLEFPLNRHTAIYTKYSIENSFSTNEKEGSAEENFGIYKKRLVLGLRVDFRLKNHLMGKYDKRLAALEKGIGDGLDVELAPVHERLEELEDEIENSHGHEGLEAIIKEHIYNTAIHHKGFSYIPEFKHIAFPFGSSKFDEAKYEKRLSDLAEFLKQNPKLKIKLVGYADAKTGDASYNLKLSAKRAKRVFDYLDAMGVDAQRMKHIGVGETLQFSIDELAENRRTEIIIIN